MKVMYQLTPANAMPKHQRSVPRDFLGRDGAIRFYFADARAELLLFKYCGQP